MRLFVPIVIGNEHMLGLKIARPCSSVVRVPPCHGGSRGFKSLQGRQWYTRFMLGHIPQFDKRSLDFSFAENIKDVEIKKTEWKAGTNLNQFDEGACVGFAWLAALLAEPDAPSPQPRFSHANELAINFYKGMQKKDLLYGEDYSGTSVLAGAWYVKDHGMVDKYLWCFSAEDVIKAVCSTGPVVAGIRWYDSMRETREDGLINLETMHHYSRHAIVITGYDPAMKFEDGTHEVLKFRNSWGIRYGVKGDAYIKVEDFKKLLHKAEMCVPVGKNPPQFDEKGRLDVNWKSIGKPNYLRILITKIIAFLRKF